MARLNRSLVASAALAALLALAPAASAAVAESGAPPVLSWWCDAGSLACQALRLVCGDGPNGLWPACMAVWELIDA